jgi:PAS domain S-box-containing protein
MRPHAADEVNIPTIPTAAHMLPATPEVCPPANPVPRGNLTDEAPTWTSLEHNHQIEIDLLRRRLGVVRRSIDEIAARLNRSISSEQALHDSEERFRLFVEGVQDYAIFMLDLTGRVMTWNVGAQRIKGYRAEEIVGRHFSTFYPPEDIRGDKPARALAIAAREGQYQEEGWRLRKDGSRFWANALITALYDATGQLQGFGKLTRDMTERKRAEEEISRHNRDLAVLNTIVIAANESSDVLALLTATLAQIGTIAAIDGAACWLAQADGVLALVATYGLAPDVVSASQAGGLPSNQELPGVAFANGAPVYVADAQADERYRHRNLAHAAGYRSLLCMPILGGAAPLGAFTLYSRELRAFTPELQTLLITIAGQLAVAIERARLYEAERQRAAQLARSTALIAALSRVAAHIETTRDPGQLLETLGAELKQLGMICVIMLLDPDTRDLIVHYTSIEAPVVALIEQSIGQKVCGMHLPRERLPHFDDLVEHRRAHVLSDVTPIVAGLLPGLMSGVTERVVQLGMPPGVPMICLPLTIGQRVLGVLGIWGTDLREDDVPAALVFTGQVASAIENARLFEQIHAGRERLRQLSQQIIVAQEDERRRIARELHDESGQALTALKIKLEMLKADLPHEDATLHGQLATAVTMVDATMERMRSLALALRPPALDAAGLNAALEGYCQSFAEYTGLVADYAGVELPIVPDPVGICLYRLLQEALTNVAKHAHARHVWIVLQCDHEEISLSVEDDGEGFDLSALRSSTNGSTNMGLLGMRERLQLLDGRLDVDLQVGRGVHLVAHIPWKERQ